jgi:hypothetical protein
MRHRFVQILGKQDDTESSDVLISRFWAPAKAQPRHALTGQGSSDVVDLASWKTARDARRER